MFSWIYAANESINWISKLITYGAIYQHRKVLLCLHLIIEHFVRHVNKLNEGPLQLLLMIFQPNDLQIDISEFWSIFFFFDVKFENFVSQETIRFFQKVF